MKLLLDTCTLLWWWSEPEKLSSRCKTLICDPINIIFISAASAWEIATKYRIGKYPGGARIITEWDDRLHIDGFREMAISSTHAFRAGTLPGKHKDPFDRMFAAQGILENIPVATPDTAIYDLGAELVW